MSNAKCCNWSITINNPTDEDQKQWAGLKGLHWVKEVAGQLEKGQDGTPHIQGMIKTQSVRFAQVKKALPRAHIEPAKNPLALAQYVKKEETRIGTMPTIKVATQSDVQNRLLSVLQTEGWKRYSWTGDPKACFDIFLREKAYAILEDWELWTDSAVKELIRDGYYGVEFVMANPQVRTAFRKYIVEILYRQWQSTVAAALPVAPANECLIVDE